MFIGLCSKQAPKLQKASTIIALKALVEISGLDGCPCLERLWLAENDIKFIAGLEGCRKLRYLYLYSNRISAIQNLDHLHELEVRTTRYTLLACSQL